MDDSDRSPPGNGDVDEIRQEELDESVREAIERSKLGAPAVGEAVRDRFSADEVFQRIIAAADEEVTSGGRELLFSGIAAGFAISITFLLYASMSAASDSKVIGAMLYPLGFIYIIIGGYQLYTENTLPPVALTIERLASLPTLLRHWTIVLAGNFIGGAAGAVVLTYGGVFEPAAAEEALYIARKGAFETAWWSLFFKALFAGLIVAGVVWVSFASRDTISRMVVVYLAFLGIPLGNLFHVVVSFTEALYLMFHGELAFVPGMTGFVLPVLLGNTIGGIVLVTVVNYFQTSEQRLESARFEGIERRLSPAEWMLGRVAGRSYVPILDPSETDLTEEGDYRIMVPISNPRTESRTVELACMLASSHENAVVHAVHVVQAPERMSLGSKQRRRITAASEKQLETLRDDAAAYDITFETSTTVTHRSFEEVFNIARRTDPDLVLMGWTHGRLWSAARAERPLAELTNQLPCDFLVVKDRGLDTSKFLLPTAGGPDSDLSAEVARGLQEIADTEVTILHVVDGPEDKEAGKRFIREWAVDRGLSDADIIVDDSGDVEGAIEREAENHTIVALGATEQGLLSRLVTETLHLDVVGEVDCSIMLSERPSERSILERLFGSSHREKPEKAEP
ncbi:formate/nitrite transporter family protein [Natronomonas halophila]|uniref:formate/nitrite transporter family protein n=1 Tax=Natronomonas halophila TaxID=2747817 RepID=UPI0015B55F85|nr:formate/nitrite transporter family protein [Natronomonas halophila]QLD86368.1 formate/nitrite transporter family protein [Natronomonas halophila]